MKTNYSNASMLDIVFENRNKAFGAYVLRRDYNQTVSRAMLITISSVFLLLFGNFLREHLKANTTQVKHWVEANPTGALTFKKKEVPVIPPSKHIEPPAPRQTSRDPEMRVVAQAQATDSVTLNKDVVHDPGITTTNPINSNPLGVENGKGKGVVFEVKSEPTGPSAPLIVAEVMPEYPGGEKALMKFLAENTQYPDMLRENGIGGRVVTQFTVNEDGSISDIGIVRSPAPGFDKEVVRVIKILKPFKPGMQQGKPVKVRFVLPFTFKTND